MKLLVKKLKENAILPKRQTEYSAGYDLCACCDTTTVKAGETVKIPTGISVEFEGTKECAMYIFARSSMATKFGIAPANCVGVIDWDYRGEVIVALKNSSANDYVVNYGDRIAQLVIMPVFTPEVEECEELSDTQRGEGGFGSTGKK